MTARIIARRATGWVLRGLLLAVLVVVALSVSVLVFIPRATHGVAMDVLTGSMTPGIPVGSVVVDRPVDTRTLRVGDIATYQVQPGKSVFITHRIVGINQRTTPETFTFKGDANRGADLKPVPAAAIRGKVWFHLPYLGALRDTLRSPSSVKKFALILLAGYALFQGVAALKQRRGRASASAARLVEGDVLLMATLSAHSVESVDASTFAALLGGTVVDADPLSDNFTVVFQGPPQRIQRLQEALQELAPLELEVASRTKAITQ